MSLWWHYELGETNTMMYYNTYIVPQNALVHFFKVTDSITVSKHFIFKLMVLQNATDLLVKIDLLQMLLTVRVTPRRRLRCRHFHYFVVVFLRASQTMKYGSNVNITAFDVSLGHARTFASLCPRKPTINLMLSWIGNLFINVKRVKNCLWRAMGRSEICARFHNSVISILNHILVEFEYRKKGVFFSSFVDTIFAPV